MAFVLRNLIFNRSLPHKPDARGIHHWDYNSPDAAATIVAAGYFNPARDRLGVNDMIEIMALSDGTGDYLHVKVTAVPAAPGDITVAVNTEAAGA